MTRSSSTALRSSRRRQLLARSALAGLGVAVAIGGATPTLAQVTGVGTVTGTTSNGGAVGVSSGGGTTSITTGASRSIVNWNSLSVTSSEQLNFHFTNRDDIVLNRVLGLASVNGVLNGCMATCGDTGGNVWIIAANGVVIGANARINTGGFLASTGGLTDADFLDGDMNFAFSGATPSSVVTVAGGAQITAHGGTLALIAPIVNTSVGSTLTGADGGDVVYASAENYNVTFAPTGTDDLDLISFEVASRSDGAGGLAELNLGGTTNANQVFAAVVSKSGVAANILLSGAITATTASGENGDIILSAGSGFYNGFALNPGGGFEGAITQNPTSTLTAANVTMRAADAIIADTINATGQVWLDSAWAGITQTGAITAASLRAEAATGIDLSNAGNDFDTLSYIDNNGLGAVSITDADGFTITASFNNFAASGTVNLTAVTGGIAQTIAGAISAGTLNVSAVGGTIDLSAATNAVGNLGTLSSGGNVLYHGGGDYNLTGAITAGATGEVALRSDGAISQTGGAITAASLTALAANGISLSSATNDVDTIAMLMTGAGNATYVDADGFELDGIVRASTGTISLTAGGSGAISQTSSGTIRAATLNVTAGGDIMLTRNNEVGSITGLSGYTVVFNNVGDLTLAGTLAASAGLFLTSGGEVRQTSGAITTNSLTVNASTGISLDSATNSFNTISGLTSGSGDISARNSGPVFYLVGDISTSGDVSLRADGGNIQQMAGRITADTLNLYARDAITLTGNSIAKLGDVYAGTDFTTNTAGLSSGVLELVGDITANWVVLHNPGGINQTAGGISAGSIVLNSWGGDLSATGANSVTGATELIGANITYNSDTDLILRLTASGSASIVSGGSLRFGGFTESSVGGTLNLDAETGISQALALSAGGFGTIINRTSGGIALTNVDGAINLTGNVTATGQTVSLRSNNSVINQTGGIVTADVLNATAAGAITLYNDNAVTSLGRMIAGGNFRFRNASNLVVGDDITASGYDVLLVSNNGSVTQTAGSDIASRSLGAVAETGITLTNADNAVQYLNSFRSFTGGIAFAQTNGFQITAPIRGDGQTVSLSSILGSISQSFGGDIAARTLNLSAGDAITLTGNNSVTNLGTVSSGGAFSFHNLANLTLTGDITAVGQVQLSTANGGAINQTGGGIIADRLLVNAEGDITLGSATNDVTSLFGLTSANGAILYRNADSFDIQGNITTALAQGVVLRTADAGATITQTSGVIDVGFFGADANGSVTINGATNQIRRLVATRSSTGNISINTATDLVVGQPVTAGQTLSLTSGGQISQDSNGYVVANTLNLSAVTGISLPNVGPTSVNSVQNLGTITNTTSGGIVIGNYSGSTTSLTGNITAAGQSVSITDVAGGLNQTGGVITADTLSLSATGAISAARNNSINSLGSVSSGGTFSFVNTGQLYLTGDINAAGQIVSLTASGGQIEQTTGVITADLLNLTAGGRIWVNNANAVSSLGRVIAGGHVLFRNNGNTVVGDDITASGFDVTLRSNNGSVTQTAGSDITSQYLQVIAATGITLTNLGNAVGEISWLDTNSGAIAFGQTNGFNLTGPIFGGGKIVSLSSANGAINQTGGNLSAGTLNLSAAGAITLGQNNTVINLGAVSSGGAFTLHNQTDLTLTGNVTAAGQIRLSTAYGSSITQTGGIITATSLDAQVTGSLALDSANAVSGGVTLAAGGDLTYRNTGSVSVTSATAGGAVSLRSNTGSVTQTGAITGATLNVAAVTGVALNNIGNDLGALGTVSNTTSGQISFTNTGDFDLTGAITAGGSQFVSLTSINGGMTQQAGGSITAQVLSVSAWGGATLGGDNDVDTLGIIVGGPAFIFNDIDGFDISAALNAQTADLSAGGAITQSTGNLNVGTLSLTAASATLTGANNITTLGDVDVAGDMSFRDTSELDLGGHIVVGGTLSLNVTSNDILQLSGSVLEVGRLEAYGREGIRVSNSGNTIGQLGDLTTFNGNISIVSNGLITIDGDLSAGGFGDVSLQSADNGLTMTGTASITTDNDVTLRSAGNIVLGDIDAGTLLNVTAIGGAISSTAAPTITTARLQAFASNGITVTGSNIDIDQFGLVSAGSGAFSLTGNNGPLDLDGNLFGSTITLGTTGAITQSSGVIGADVATISAGGALTLNRANTVGTVSLNGTDVSYTSANSFAANVVTASGAVSLTSTNGKITQTALTGKIVANSLTASAATGLEFFGGQNDIAVLNGLSSTSGGVTYRDMGGFDIAGNITAAGQQVELVSDGTGADGNDITQSGGVISAASITGTSAGDFLLTRANTITRVNAMTAGGDLTYRSAAAVELWGNLTAGGTLNLISDAGAVMQNGGAITAQTLTGSAAAGLLLSRINDVDTIGAVSVSSGEFTFRDADSFNIAGAVQAANGITLQAGGDIIQTTGSLTTSALQAYADGRVDLGGAGNAIVSLLAGFAMGDFTYADTYGFTLDGNVFSGGVMRLGAANGSINQNDGVLTAQILNASASSEINLTKANAVAMVGDLSAAHRVYFANGDNLSISGDIDSNVVVLVSFDGGVTQNAGAITAATLAVEAALGVNLDQAGNDVDTINSISARGGGLIYRDVDSVQLSGVISIAGAATFNVGGDLTQTWAGMIFADRIQGSAGGAFDLATATNYVAELGPVTADQISFKTGDGLDIVGDLNAATGTVSLEAGDTLRQSGGVIIADTLLAESPTGDIDLDGSNTVSFIQRLRASNGDVTFRNSQGFELAATAAGDILAGGVMTLTADTGSLYQSGYGLQATTLVATAAGDIILDLTNQVENLGDISAGIDFTFVNEGDLALTGDITSGPNETVRIVSNTGAITQTGGVITADLLQGSAATGIAFGGDNVVNRLGTFDVSAGDFLYNGVGNIVVSDLISVGSGKRISLTTNTGSISTTGAGRLTGGALLASGGGAIDLEGDVDQIDGLITTSGDVAWNDDDGFDIAGDLTGDGVALYAHTGNISQSGGVITTGATGLQVYANGGDAILDGANMITALGLVGTRGSFSLVNARSFNISDAIATGGDLTLRTTSGDIVQTAATGLQSEGDMTITAAGLLDLKSVAAGDDLALAGETVHATYLRLLANTDAEGDGSNITIAGGLGGVRIGAVDSASISSFDTIYRSAGTGAVTITSDGDIDLNLDYTNTEIGFTAAGDAKIVLANNDLDLADVSAAGFDIEVQSGDLNADSVTVGGGDYTVNARFFTGSALDLDGTARDISITARTSLSLTANLVAQRNLTITTPGSVTQTGSFGVVAGADMVGSGNVTINAYGITLDTIGADGSVTLDVGTGTVDVATVIVRDDYNLTGAYFSTGALTPLGATLGTWNLHVAAANLFNNTLTYNGDIAITADAGLEGIGVQSIYGGVTIDGADDVIFDHILAGEGIRVTAAEGVSLGWATAEAGDIDLTGRSAFSLGQLEASGDVDVNATDGNANIAGAKAGGDITIAATDGNARLGAASLTGLTGDLTVTATNGTATLGATDYTFISTDNVFERAAGHIGTVSITGDDGAMVYLDRSASIDLLRGGFVDAVIADGDVAFGTIEATTDDVYIETLNGSLILGAVTASNGAVELYTTAGDITLTGNVHGGDDVTIGADGLLDGTLAGLISSDSNLMLTGNEVRLGRLEAAGDAVAIGIMTDAYVDFISAGGMAVVTSFDGNATLRGAEADDGISVQAGLNATFGADDKSLITSANYGVTGACGCSYGIVVGSQSGNAVVNLHNVTGHFQAISALFGDVDVNLLNGNLTVGELSGYNIKVDVAAGTIETGYGGSPYGAWVTGGSYSLKARDFLGDALRPLIADALGDPTTLQNYTIIDTYGQLSLGALSVVAAGDILIEAQDGPVTGSAQLTSDGDVTVSATAVALDLIDAGGDAFVSASSGGIALGSRIDADGDLTLQAQSAVTGNAVLVAGGDLTVDAAGIIVDVAQAGNDVTLRSYGNALTVSAQVMAGRDVLLDAGQSGALNSGLVSGGRDVKVNASSITLDSVQATRDLELYSWYGPVDVATSVTIGRNYTLTGRSFSAAALTPLGNRTGNLTITSNGVGLDYSAGTLTYGGDISITSLYGPLIGGAVTSYNGDITILGSSVAVGALSAESGQIDVQGTTGADGVTIASARASDLIYVYASNGDAVLGSATLLGTGANSLTVRSVQNGNAYLGAKTAAGITAANVFSSAGATTDASVTSAFGSAYVRLNSSSAITEITGPVGVGVTVLNGAFSVGTISSLNGDVTLNGPSGGVTVGSFLGDDVTFTGGDITLTSGRAYGDLTLDSTGDIVLLGPSTPQTSARIDAGGELSLSADGGITKSADAILTAASVSVDAGEAVSLLGLNAIATLAEVSVLNGGFTYESRNGGGLQITGPINLAGQTLDLRIFGGPLTQTAGSVITAGRLTGTSSGAATLNGANQIAQLGDFSVDNNNRFFLNVDRALTIDGLVQTGGGVTIQSDMMVISANGTIRSMASGDAVVLAANGAFVNQSGADAIQADFGRWLVYSQAYNDPTGSTGGDSYGGLGGRSYYGVGYDFDGGGFGGAVGAGNRFVHAYRPVITFTPISKNVTYNGLVPGVGYTVSGVRAHDVGSNPYSGDPLLSGATSKNVGTYVITASLGSLLSDMNYDFAFGTGTLVIDPKVLTGTLTAQNKTYDGTNTAAGLIVLNGVVLGDDVNAAAASYTFGDKNAGLGKTVTANGAVLSGGDAGNYVLSPLATALADILRRNISAVVVADDKTYDGTTTASGSLTVTGFVTGDDVAANATYSFGDKNAGTGKTVTANATLSGDDAGNYELSPIGTAMADILRKTVTIAITVNNKTYDGTTTASGGMTVTGLIAGDDASVTNGTFSFGDANAGTGKTVTIAGVTLTGSGSGNYELAGVPTTLLADILRRQVSVRADDQLKLFGQLDPALTYRITAGSLVAGDGFTGGLLREPGDVFGSYTIGQGSLALSANYDLHFTSGVFQIRPVPGGGQDGGAAFRYLQEPKPFSLEWDPTEHLTFDRTPVCLSLTGCGAE